MPVARISVTEVRNALRCPRVFALGRMKGNIVAFPVGSSCLGGTFHRIVDRFTQAVASPPAYVTTLPAGASAEERRDVFTRWLLDFLVDELERDPSYRSMPAEVDDLAQALRELAGHLAQRAARGQPAQAMSHLLQTGERSVEATLPEASVTLTGRIDALYAGAGAQLDVVEYKLTAEENDAVDQAQVALYRELLRRADGVDARPVILRFNPALTVSNVPEKRADELVQRELVPLLRRMAGWAAEPTTAPATTRRDLCAACPVAVPCAAEFPARMPVRDDPPMAAAHPRPSAQGNMVPPAPLRTFPVRSGDEEGRKEAEAIRKRILEELRRDGVAVQSPDAIIGPRLFVVSISRPRGPVAELDRKAQDVVHRLATASIDAVYRKDGARRSFEVQRRTPRPVELKPLLEEKREWLSERPGRFIVGQQSDGRLLVGDLADSATPHLLIGGQAGSGKSWLLRSLVASLVHWHGPSELRITLLDPKRVTFNVPGFQTAIASHLDGPLLYGVEDALPCFERYVEVMEERYQQFEAEKVSDLHEYNQSVEPGRRLPRHVVVMDEFQDLTADKRSANAFCTTVARLGAKSRAAGVHLILATQRPDRETVPSVLKANLGGKIALRVASAVNSRIILDVAGAEELLGKGDLLADLGQGIVRAQAAVTGA